jgi:hypothetical protein
MSGGGASVDYKTPWQQQQLLQDIIPLWQNMAAYGVGNMGAGGLYDQPSAPQPTSGWFNSISPEVMAGLWEPYDFAANQMAEQLNFQGSLGAGGQYTGNALGNFGDFYSKAGTQLGTQAWNMMSPGLWADYQSQMQEMMMPYQLLGMAPQMMPTGIVQNQPNTAGNAFGGAATGAMSGAMLGSAIPGLGTGVGAAIGGGAGLLSGLFAG